MENQIRKPLFRILIYPTKVAIERMLNGKYKEILVENDFAVHEEKANISFKIQFNEEQNLFLKPVLIPLLGNKKEYHEIVKMEKHRFGRYYYLKNHGFISLKPARPFFPEKEAGAQTSFNFNDRFKKSATGVPTNINTLVPKEEVLDFVQRHAKELSRMDEALVPPSIKQPEFLDLDSNVVFDFDSSQKGWCHLSVYYKTQSGKLPQPNGATAPVSKKNFVKPCIRRCKNQNQTPPKKTKCSQLAIQSDMVSFYDLYQARKMGKKFLITENKWVSTSSQSLQWLDDISEKSIIGKKNKKIKLSPLEYLKLRFSMSGEVKYAGKKDKNTFFLNLEKFKPAKKAPTLTKLGISLWDYQIAGYEWLWFLFQNRFGGLLSDDMGLGKTHQAMALMKAITIQSPKKSIFLVVCPTSVLSHWEAKLEQYCSDLQTLLYHGNSRKLPGEKTNIILTSYGTLRRDIHKFERYSFDLFVLDEIQTLKNKSTAVYQALKHIKSAVSIGLTGTPIENSTIDLKNLLDFVLPGFLPGESEFKKRFVEPIELNNNMEAKHALSRMVYPFVLRRTKQQVLTELPEKIEDKRYCLLSDDQVKLYKDIIHNQGAKALALLKSGERIPYIHIFAAMNYLKQICNHPAMLSGNPADLKVYKSGKWDLFCEILEECLNSKLKVVIFSQYVKMLKLIETYLKENEIQFATIKGNTRNRKEMLDRFRKDASCSVFTCSLKAGGLGIDLTAASVVIHYDRWWNQAREDQATDRVHRTGQKDGVQVIKFLTRGTLEEKIDVLIQKKQALANAIVKQDNIALSKQFTREELESLLTF